MTRHSISVVFEMGAGAQRVGGQVRRRPDAAAHDGGDTGVPSDGAPKLGQL